MKIGSWIAACVSLALAGTMPVANAGTPPPDQSAVRHLPVLVSVDRQGEVTEIQPAFDVPEQLRPMLRTIVQKMITGPAETATGRPAASQTVFQFGLATIAGNNGSPSIKFSYEGAVLVPYGPWSWGRDASHRLVLQRANGQQFRRFSVPDGRDFQQNPSVMYGTVPNYGANLYAGSRMR